jgi:hypothetical protein
LPLAGSDFELVAEVSAPTMVAFHSQATAGTAFKRFEKRTGVKGNFLQS